jgi:hypothetical protein
MQSSAVILLLIPTAVYSFVLSSGAHSQLRAVKDISAFAGFDQQFVCSLAKGGIRSERRPSSVQMSASRDLVVVGAGYLGSMLVKEYKSKYPAARVIAETRLAIHANIVRSHCHLIFCSNTAQIRSTSKHTELKQIGAEPRTREQRPAGEKVDNVVFCAPPGGNDDYVGEVQVVPFQAPKQLHISLSAPGPGRRVSFALLISFHSAAGISG